ncbi:MAG: chemotaxis protein CheW [Acidiferrobacterales bacterium]|nr:chemotaxis protein CheW [Acidiferrobacterales bacterium]
MAEINAFDLLAEIRSKAVDLAGQNITYSIQSAGVKNIAYVVNGLNFYCDSEDVREVSTSHNIMPVPQTKRWMRGLFNSKGVLYSVTDLSLFAGFDRAIQENRGHLLLLSDADKQSALLVNKVIGFRYFEGLKEIENLESNSEIPDGLSSFVSEAFQVDDETWYRLDVPRLLESEQFLEVQ